MRLKKQVSQLLQNTMGMLAGFPELSELLYEAEAMHQRLKEPLRVAVVGFMKAGKSTLMNAILRDRVLFTGSVETTYRVSWFKYGPKPALQVVFQSGQTLDAPFSDLKKWTVRESVKTNPQINEVSYIIVFYPNETLKVMELIDTPGLFSSHETDAANTLKFLGLKEAEQAHKITAQAAATADAIVYAFSRGLQDKDAEVLNAFQSGSLTSSTPINALGVFTKSDIFWDLLSAPEVSPLDTVAPALEGYQKLLRDKLYGIYPVCAKAAECGAPDEGDWAVFQRLSHMPEEELSICLSDAHSFAHEPDGQIPAGPQERARLLERYGQYGIYLLTAMAREGASREDTAQRLYELSGVGHAAEIIRRHFGNRAFLIKLNYIFRRLWTTASRLKQGQLSNNANRICRRIMEDIDTLLQKEQAFCELHALQNYYHGRFQFTSASDERSFLQLTGEYGSGCCARLGLSEPARLSDLKQRAWTRCQEWSRIANDYGAEPALAGAASVLVRTCETLYYHLEMLSGYED